MKRILTFGLLLLAAVNVMSQPIAGLGYTVDVLPTNIGGKSEFKRVFEQELIYPEKALAAKQGGVVEISFTLRADSVPSDIRVKSCGIAELDAEANRLFKLFQWVPAIREGKYIDAPCNATFEFDPARYSKICKRRGFTKPEYIADSPVDSSIRIVINPEQVAMYPKGNYALQDFIRENLEYPRQAQLANIQGKVVLRFVVEPTGLVTNIGVVNSVAGGCDQEAIRILEMIKWYPARHQGKLVRAQMSFPFYFVLSDEFKDNSAGEQK
jgi:protein TonB